MANHKNLKKVIAVSSMAAVTMGAGAMVNADNVHQPVSSQKSSISTKVSSESQSVKSSKKVVLKSSQSSKTSLTSSVKSSKKSVSSSSAKAKVAKVSTLLMKHAQPMNLAAVQQGAMVNDVKSTTDTLMNDYNKWSSSNDSDLSYDASDAKTAYDSIMQIAKQYDEGDYANKSDYDYIVKNVANSLKNAKSDYDMSKTLSDVPNLQEKQQIYKDIYEAWNNLYNLLTNGESSQGSSQSSKVSTTSKKDDANASSTNSTKKTSASSQDSEQASSENHGNGTPNVTPAQSDDIVNALQPKVDKIADDINKDENSNDPAVIDALSGAAKAADEITDTVNNFIYGKATPADTMNAIKNFENKIAELQKQIANEKNPTIKAILQDELDAYQATVNKLEEYLNNKSSVPAGTVSHSGNSNSAETVSHSGNSDSAETVSHSENSVSTKKSGSSITSSMTAKKVVKNEKAMKDNSAKKASMPQTGEANNTGILAGIGALVLAAAGAFLFRKRG